MRNRTKEHDQEFSQSIDEIAASEGISKQAVVKTINKALNKLRRRALSQGLSFDNLIWAST